MPCFYRLQRLEQAKVSYKDFVNVQYLLRKNVQARSQT